MLRTFDRYMCWVSAAIRERDVTAVVTSKTAIAVCSATRRKSRCPTETFSNTVPATNLVLICRLSQVQSVILTMEFERRILVPASVMPMLSVA